MLEVDSPWLVNLAATLKDDANIYMLLEAVMGGELFAYLQASRHLSAIAGPWGPSQLAPSRALSCPPPPSCAI
jgi:hypothetical protein